MAYIVNAEMPKFCNKCPFGFCKFSLPISDGTHGYTCNLELPERGHSKTTVITDCGVDVEKPDWCPLRTVPEKKKEKYMLQRKDCFGNIESYGEETDRIAVGYNQCIDDILGGAE